MHIEPDERDTLAHVPAELVFPAPRLPAGNVLLGYDEQGHCPMLVDDRCSIYEHRPRTCRTYDCRVFPAAGIEPSSADQDPVARQARRWRFVFPEGGDRLRHEAVRAAAAYVQARADAPTPTQHAVLAVRLHEAFLGDDGVIAEPPPEVVQAMLSPEPAPRRRHRGRL